MDIHALVEQKVQEDTTFQETLATLDDTSREQALADKKAEVLASEFSSLSLKAQEAEKAKELAENYKIRAEKAEKEKGGSKQATDTLTPKDYLALTENGVKSEDFDEIVRVAGLLGKPVSDALQDNVLKTILKTRIEERATALATQTGGGNRGVKSLSSDVLLQKAQTGEVGEDDIEKLTQARMEQRSKK